MTATPLLILIYGGFAVYFAGVAVVFLYTLARLGRPYARVCLRMAVGWPQSFVATLLSRLSGE